MAASGSLQHIFENPLPENTTFLSSWNQIMPRDESRSGLVGFQPRQTEQAVNPTEQPSFTEIFGELHFQESFVPSSPSPPPTIPTLNEEISSNGGSDDPVKDPFSTSFHRRSTSFSSTNSESLQLCTEGLGFESLDDVEDLKWQREEEEEQQEQEEQEQGRFQKSFEVQSWKPEMNRRQKPTNMEDFPPPIPCMGKSGKPWIGFKAYRYEGRFVLKEVRVPTHEFLHACRENGRLKLHILVEDDGNDASAAEEQEEQAEEEEEEQSEEEEEEKKSNSV